MEEVVIEMDPEVEIVEVLRTVINEVVANAHEPPTGGLFAEKNTGIGYKIGNSCCPKKRVTNRSVLRNMAFIEITAVKEHISRIPLYLMLFILAAFMASVSSLISVLLTKSQGSTTSTFKRFIDGYPNSLELLFIIVPCGFTLIVGLINYFFFGTAGSGIPLVMSVLEDMSVEQRALEGIEHLPFEDQALHREYIDQVFGLQIKKLLGVRILVGKFGLTLFGLLLGASIGIEGPTVQISTCVFYELSKWCLKYIPTFRRLVFKTPQTRLMFVKGIACAGGASGIAAAFNTPLGGIFFAMEEMGDNFEIHSHELVFTTVCVSGFVSYIFMGAYTYFGQTSQGFDAITVSYAVTALFCMFVGGILGGLWGYGMLVAMTFKARIPIIAQHPYVLAFVMGICFAAVSYATNGEVLLSGYSNVRYVLNNNTAYCLSNETQASSSFQLMSPGYGFAKQLATYFSYWAGISGGIFSPALASGAGWGQLFYCSVISKWYPETDSSIVTLLFMQGYFSGVTQSPLTAYSILSAAIDIGGDSTAIHFTMLSVSIGAALVSKLVMRISLYEGLAMVGLPKVPVECLAKTMIELRKLEGKRVKIGDFKYV